MNTSFSVSVSALVAVLLISSSSDSQELPNPHELPLYFYKIPDLHSDLNLSNDQVKKITDIVDAFTQTTRQLRSQQKGASESQLAAIKTKRRVAGEEASQMVAKQLNAKQLARAHQLHIQLGVVSFLSQTKVPERLEAILNLSTEQQRALDENRNGVKDGERTAAHYEATMQVLTKDQLAELLEAYGPPSKLFPPVRQYLGDPPRSVPVPASK